MDARYIMDYSAFELMYEGIRHTDVEDYAEEWQLTAEQVETLKKRLLEEENRVYECWLRELPHCAFFEQDDDAEDDGLHLFYDSDAAEGSWYVGADALTTIARDLRSKVGDARHCIKSGLFPALADYTEELLILLDDYRERAVDYDEGKRSDSDVDSPAVLFGTGWRPSEVEDIFYQWPDTFESMRDFISALRSEYISWMEDRVAEMEGAIDELDEDAPDYDEQREALADECAADIADDMICEAGLGEPQYLYQVEDYDRALSTEYGVDVYGRVLRILRKQAGVDEE
nr:MAG TPA: hypothetical protein [Caudoviricetes sp.]